MNSRKARNQGTMRYARNTTAVLDWYPRHAAAFGLQDWYDAQSDRLIDATKALPKAHADAIWQDKMLFLVAAWLQDRNSTIPLILCDHLDTPLPGGSPDGLGPKVGARVADRRSRADVEDVLRCFWLTEGMSKEVSWVQAEVALWLLDNGEEYAFTHAYAIRALAENILAHSPDEVPGLAGWYSENSPAPAPSPPSLRLVP